MMQGTYCFAGIPFRIDSIYEYVHEMCAEYRIETPSAHFDAGCPSLCDISITQQDIDFEHDVSARMDEAEGRQVQERRRSYLESLAVCRKVAEALTDHNAVLFHGSALALNGEVYLFAAASGVGKSTHARLWREAFGDRVVMVNDDKPFIRLVQGQPFVCGTPWNGKHHLSTNIQLPLKAICLLQRGTENSIRRIGFREAYPALLGQMYLPRDGVRLSRSLGVLDEAAKKASLYRLHCNMEREAAIVAYEGMRGTI